MGLIAYWEYTDSFHKKNNPSCRRSDKMTLGCSYVGMPSWTRVPSQLLSLGLWHSTFQIQQDISLAIIQQESFVLVVAQRLHRHERNQLASQSRWLRLQDPGTPLHDDMFFFYHGCSEKTKQIMGYVGGLFWVKCDLSFTHTRIRIRIRIITTSASASTSRNFYQSHSRNGMMFQLSKSIAIYPNVRTTCCTAWKGQLHQLGSPHHPISSHSSGSRTQPTSILSSSCLHAVSHTFTTTFDDFRQNWILSPQNLNEQN